MRYRLQSTRFCNIGFHIKCNKRFCCRIKSRNLAISCVRVRATSYTKPKWLYVNSVCCMCLTLYDYLRAALTYGSADLAGWSNTSWRYKSAKLGFSISTLSMLEWNTNLSVDKHISELDASEKGVLSYLYGMIFTKLTAEFVFRIPWLLHFSQRDHKDPPIEFKKPKYSPDYLGRDTSKRWHIFEAKCWSSGIRDFYKPDGTLNEPFLHGKDQVSCITSVNRRAPETSSVCAVDIKANPISIKLLDPASEEVNHEKGSDNGGFFRKYYEHLISFINEDRIDVSAINDVQFVGREFSILSNKLTLALPLDILENPINADVVCPKLVGDNSAALDGLGYASLGLDGVLLSSNNPFDLKSMIIGDNVPGSI